MKWEKISCTGIGMKAMMIKTNNMPQQTALQELIQYLDPIHSSIKQKAIELLEKEKEQIIDAYFQGFREGRGIDNIEVDGKIFYEDTNAERYYSTLFQPNENCYPKET